MTARRFDNLPEKAIYDFPPLRAYLHKVHKWHSYVRLLGLPNRRDRLNVPTDLMFVRPLVSPRAISVDIDPNDWKPQCESIYAALERYRRVLLLGAPGVGKTTLLSRLAWDITFAPSRGPFINRFGWVLPVPMMVRELPIRGVTTFDGLLDAFLSHPVGEPLRDVDYLQSRLREGRALVLLDGIDEAGDEDARRDLRAAVFDGMKRFPDCLWLLSSRIVGYAEASFESRPEPSGQNRVAVPDAEAPAIGRRYIAPFDDSRIRAFVHCWYAWRDREAHKAGRAAELVSAIARSESLRGLARVPDLLALIALVHRMEANLPQQRCVLYRRLAEAYLESIDARKGISESTLDLPRKIAWLARVGYEMQHQRQHGHEDDQLASRDDVLRWIGNEMERGRAFKDVPTPEEFLSFVGRHGGLFVLQGDDQYAFRHLSFQDYFAALALEGEVTGFKWAKSGRSSLGFGRTDVAAWARQPAWLETFCFLFEMLADRPEWHGELLSCVFGDDFALLCEMDAADGLFRLGHLAARLVANPYSGLGPRERTSALDACVRAQIRCSAHHFEEPKAYDDYVTERSLLTLLMASDQGSCDGVLASMRRQWAAITHDLGRRALDLRGAKVENLAQLNLPGLDVLILTDSDVESLDDIGKFKTLTWLELDGTPVQDISPIADVPTLEFLNLGRTNVDDIAPLARLPALDGVLLSDAPTPEAIDALREALPNCDIVQD